MATVTRPDNVVRTVGPTAAAATPVPTCAVPWYVTGVTAAATAVYIGVIWDISWHMTIGRDTFWSPPHLMTYLSAILVAVSCGYVAVKTSFSGSTGVCRMNRWSSRAEAGACPAKWLPT